MALPARSASPAWCERASWNARGGASVKVQLAKDERAGANFTALVHEAERMGPGRIYAGLRGGDGQLYRIGDVPAFTYLLNDQADAVGFTRPAWSLSSSVAATFVDHCGQQTLWTVGNGGYFQVVGTTAPLAADRTDIGAVMAPVLGSDLVRDGRFPTVAFAGAPGARPTITSLISAPSREPGSVLRESDDPASGVFRATVDANRRAMVMLKSSFDNRWQVTVDGAPMPAQMVAPSYVGRTVPAGRHVVRFSYTPFPYYWLLFALAGVTLLGLWLVRRRVGGPEPVVAGRPGAGYPS